MSQIARWKEWRDSNIDKLKSLSVARPRDMRLKQRINDFVNAEGEEIERLGLIINREYAELSNVFERVK